MSLIVKLGLVGAAGVGCFATLPQFADLRADLTAEVPGLASLATLVGAAGPAAAPRGPIDKSFTVRRVRVDGMVAHVEIVTLPQSGPIRLQANGKPETMKELQVRTVGDELVLRLDSHEDEAWFPWNLFNMWSKDRNARDLSVRISAPAGTAFDIEDMIGVINAGDIDAPLRLDGHAIRARFGRVQNARVSIAGSGQIGIGAVPQAILQALGEHRDLVHLVGRRSIAAYLNVPVYAQFHEWLGRGAALAPMWDAWKAGDRAAATAAIPDEVIDDLIVHGTVDEIKEHLARFTANGVTTPAPAILGAVIGASVYNQELATLLIGVGVGAIIQVIGQLLPAIRDKSGSALNPLSVAGILAGVLLMYLTGLLVAI